MSNRRLRERTLALLAAAFLVAPSVAAKDSNSKTQPDKTKGKVQCKMTFELRSWAVFYKSGKGEGTITCDNGKKADVKIRTHGGGIQFGKNNIANGLGKFSPVKGLDDLYGKYASVGGHGGAVRVASGNPSPKTTSHSTSRAPAPASTSDSISAASASHR